MAKDLSALAAAAAEERGKLKEEKKRFRQEQKAQKKEAKRRAAELEKQEEALEEDGGSGMATFAATLLIVVLWIAVVCVVVKMDVGGFGSSVLAPILKDVPVVKWILPSSALVDSGGDSGSYGGYASIEEAVDALRKIELELAQVQEDSNTKDKDLEALKSEVLRLQEFEQRQVEFQRIMSEFYEEVASLDPEGLLKYYESMDPTTMEYIVKQLLLQQQKDEEMDNYVKTFAAMKPKAAAKAFETMSDLDLVAKILKAMSVEKRAAILDVMSADFAAKLVKILDPSS